MQPTSNIDKTIVVTHPRKTRLYIGIPLRKDARAYPMRRRCTDTPTSTPHPLARSPGMAFDARPDSRATLCLVNTEADIAVPTLDGFLSGVGPRAFRFAELGLRHRDDALDVVQEAMLKMLAYRTRPAEEWSPLFWRILRTRIIDAQRRRRFRLGWLGSATLDDGSEMEWADASPDPSLTAPLKPSQLKARCPC